MDKFIKKKKPKDAPDWVINSLKVLLLLILFWNLNKQLPNGLLGGISNHASQNRPISPTPYIEEISYNQLLGTTTPKINHFMEWGGNKIPFLDPEITAIEAVQYQVFTKAEFAKIWVDSFSVKYKGHVLRPNKINALFISPDSTSIICESEIVLTGCFYENLINYQNDFALWLSIETEEKKTFFTKIKVSQTIL